MRPFWHSLLCMVTAAILLAATLPCQRKLLALRQSATPYRPEELQDAPPSVAFTTVALGSARGVVADLLWLRSFDMQADGQYFELTQLARWITSLAGSEPQTWTQQAWNLTYNIPPILADPDAKWRWVESGIQLLRRDGVQHAGSPELYAELSFMHSDKLGGQVDPASPLYARRFATGIAPLLDNAGRLPPPDDPRASQLADAYGVVHSVVHELESRYQCSLDFRNPVSHAAYWAMRGKLGSPPNKPSKRCDRLFYQALTSLYLRGRSLSPLPLRTALDPSFFRGATRAHAEAARQHPNDPMMPATHAMFLSQATHQLHDAGYPDLSRDAFRELLRRYPQVAVPADYDAYLKHPKDNTP